MIRQEVRPQRSAMEPVVLSRHGGLSVTVAPEHGARIAQITDPRGHNWLADTGAGELADGAPVEFAGGTRGGWDECLPSVSACADPSRPGFDVADHGDFWATPWAVQRQDDDSVSLVSDVPGHPLQVRKTVRLPADRERLLVEIEVRNRSELPYRFLYSAHPLWAFQHDAVVDIPGAGQMITAFGTGWPEPMCGEWPMLAAADAAPQNISQIARRGGRSNYKVFVRWAGRASYAVPALGSAVLVTQSPGVTPWLGLCVNRGGYPDSSAGDYWIALEPTTAPTDSLFTAVESGWAVMLDPAGVVRWTTEIEVVHGRPARS